MATIINPSTLASLRSNIEALIADVNRTTNAIQGGGSRCAVRPKQNARKRTARKRTVRKRTTRKRTTRKRTVRKRTARRA